MKNFIIIALMLFTFISFSQNEFVGQWNSAIQVINVSYKNDSLIVKLKSSPNGAKIKTLSAKIIGNKLFISSYFKPNNFYSKTTITIGIVKNKGHGVVTNKNGTFNIVYIKKIN
jgi:hypothetical protein|tara:strand:+ start:93 stop:434 length:342 start_codon:yes stop_codon:yes gene_type:complete